MKFHPIRKSWDLNEAVLKEGHETVDIEDAEVKDIEGEDIEGEDMEVEDIEAVGIEGEDVEVADIDKLDEEDIPAWSDVTTPSSPIFGVLTDDGLLPPSSDASAEFVDVINSDDYDEVQGLPTLKRKAPDKLDIGAKSRWKVARREEAGRLLDDGSGVETDDGNKPSQSATASRRLRESVRSGEFVADEQKKRFEGRCIEKDQGVKFRYNAGWQVLHSKCSKWFKMSEPYNTTRFKIHIGTCKARGNERNTSIMSFFKPTDLNNVEAKPKITISGQKQIFVGGSTSKASTPIKPPHSNNQLVP